MYSFPIWSLSKSVEPPARFSRNFLYIWFPTRNLVPAWPRFAAVTRNQGTCPTYPHSCPWKVTSFLNGWLEHRNPTLWLLQLKKRGSCRCSVQKSWEFCRAASLNTVIFYRFPASTPIGYMICIIYIWYYVYIYILRMYYIYIFPRIVGEIPMNVPCMSHESPVAGEKSSPRDPSLHTWRHPSAHWDTPNAPRVRNGVRTPLDHPLIKITRKSWKITRKSLVTSQ